MSSKGLYERRRPKVPGLSGLGLDLGKSIAIADNKGTIRTVANASGRYIFSDIDNLSATAAVTTAGTVTTLSAVPLDPSGVAADTYEVGFMLDDGLQPSTINFTIYGRMEETTNAVTAWAGTTGNILGDIVAPTASANIAGLYFICTTAGTTAGVEPTWPTTEGGTVTDGTAVWTAFIPSIAMDVTILAAGDSDNWEAGAGDTVTTDDIDIVCPTDPTTNGYPMNKIEFSLNMSDFSITPGDFVLIKLERVAIASTAATDGELPTDITLDKVIVDFI